MIESQSNHSALGLTDEKAGFFEFRDVMGEGGLGDPHLIEYGTAGDPLSAGVLRPLGVESRPDWARKELASLL